MDLLSMEQSPGAYRADFVLYGTLVLLLIALSLWNAAPRPAGWLAALLAGFALWSLIEYLVHRFVLHGIQPFKRLHAVHHARPRALYGLPTLFSLPLFAGLVFLPLLVLLGLWPTLPLMAGVLAGYLFYGLAHHLAHQGLSRSWPGPAWQLRRKRWHAHHHSGQAACYGVSTGFWDQLLGTGRRKGVR